MTKCAEGTCRMKEVDGRSCRDKALVCAYDDAPQPASGMPREYFDATDLRDFRKRFIFQGGSAAGNSLADALDELAAERKKVLELSEQCRITALERHNLQSELTNIRAEHAARGTELYAIDDALGTNEGHSAVSHINALRAKLAVAEKDAERYRWLRQQSTVPCVSRHGDTQNIIVFWDSDDGDYALDHIIDAALAGEKP